MIKDAVHNHPHSPPVGFLHHLNKQPVAGLQIFTVCHPVHIFGRGTVFPLPLPEQIPLIIHQLSEVRVNIVIVLNIIFVIGGRDKKRIEINHLHPQILQIIHFIQDTLQIPSVKVPYIHLGRITIPVLHPAHRLVNITVFAGLNII